MYADYIFPDLTYLERWEFVGIAPLGDAQSGARSVSRRRRP